MKSQEAVPEVIPDPPRPIDWKEARRLYVEEQLSYAEIARRMGHHLLSVRRVLLRHGVPKHRPSPGAGTLERKRIRGIWKGFMRCCRDPRRSSFKHYGAKGIRWYGEWEEFNAFYEWARKSGYQPGWSLALNEGAEVFSPSSCRWISPAERTKRRLRLAPRRSRRIITAFGETKGAAAWARDPRCKVTLENLCQRIDRGVRPEDAMVLPEAALRAMPRRNRRVRKLKRPHYPESLNPVAHKDAFYYRQEKIGGDDMSGALDRGSIASEFNDTFR